MKSSMFIILTPPHIEEVLRRKKCFEFHGQKVEYHIKDMSMCHKLKFANPFIFAPYGVSFDILNWDYFIHSLHYRRFMTHGCKDLGIKKSEFVA